MPLTRRTLILGAGAAITAAAWNRTYAADGPTRPLKIVVTGGHPGDPEYGCGGTIRRFTQAGHAVTLLYLNNGAWPPTPASTRLAEAAAACRILHATPRYADQENGHAIVDEAHYDAFATFLTAEAPDLVLTHWPLDNHRDHRAISQLTYDVWQRSRHRFALYYYEVSDGEDTLQFTPDHYVDITTTEPDKRAACFAHASQTPDRYYKLQDDVAAMRGLENGCHRAEAFTLQRPGSTDPLQILTAR